MKIVSPIRHLRCSLCSEHTKNCFNINIEFKSNFSAFRVSPAGFYSKKIRVFLLSSYNWIKKTIRQYRMLSKYYNWKQKVAWISSNYWQKGALKSPHIMRKICWQNNYKEIAEHWMKWYGCFLQAKWTLALYPGAAGSAKALAAALLPAET